MHKKMTITLDEAVYDGLYRVVGRRKMSQFIEDLLRPHVLDAELEANYKAMAVDTGRNVEIDVWNAADDADFANTSW